MDYLPKGPFTRAIFVATFLILTHVINEWLSHKSIDSYSYPFNRMHQKEKDRSKNRLCKRALINKERYVANTLRGCLHEPD